MEYFLTAVGALKGDVAVQYDPRNLALDPTTRVVLSGVTHTRVIERYLPRLR